MCTNGHLDAKKKEPEHVVWIKVRLNIWILTRRRRKRSMPFKAGRKRSTSTPVISSGWWWWSGCEGGGTDTDFGRLWRRGVTVGSGDGGLEVRDKGNSCHCQVVLQEMKKLSVKTWHMFFFLHSNITCIYFGLFRVLIRFMGCRKRGWNHDYHFFHVFIAWTNEKNDLEELA